MENCFYSRPPIKALTTLLVSPSERDQTALIRLFAQSNWNLYSSFTTDEALVVLRREVVPVVICDRDLALDSWRSFVQQANALCPAPRMILASREVGQPLWADVLQVGAYDLLMMPWDVRQVRKVIPLAWRSWEFANRVDGPELESDLASLRSASAGGE